MKTNPLLKKTACVLSIALAFSALTPIKILATENASGTTANTSTAVSENALANISDLRAKRIASRKVELTFTGVSGATHYVIKRQTVGNASSEKIFTVANSPYIDTYVASGQAYTYTVHPALAEQEGNASNVAEIAALPKEEQVDDRDPRIRYGSAYANYSTSNLYMCTEKYIDINGNPNQPEANSTLELDFVGTGIEIYGNKNKNLGKAHIYIDGRELEMADFWKAGNNAEEGVLIKRIENLENGPHTLKIRLSVTHEKRTSEERRKISLDYFKILQENGHKILDDRDPSIRYGSAYGDWLADTLYMCTEKFIDINGNPNQAEANSTLEFDFVGTGIEIYGNKSRQLGKAHVYIDGVEVGEADFWKTANNNNAEKGALITRIDNLADGLHTLKMRVNVTAQKRHTEERRKISLDFFRILREEDYKVLDDRDPRISYGSVFTNWSDDALYKKTQKDGDRQRNHNDEQATATLTFTGTGVEVYGLKTNQLGKATVTIDDQEKEDLNFNIASSNGQKGVLIGRYDGLQDGQHTLKIKVSNQAVGSSRTKISLDKLVILKNPPLMQHPAVPKQVENEELNIELPNHSEWTRLEIALPEVADKVVLNASDVPNESTESTATSGTTNFRRVGNVLKYRLPSQRTAGLVRVETFNQEQSLGTEVSYVSEAVVSPVDNSLREAKEQASQAIEQAHNEKLQALEAISPALTTEEKAERTQSLTQAKEQALQAVNDAENVEAVENAKNAGIAEIGNVPATASEKKEQAKQAIDQEALTKLAEINTSSLTTEERQAKTALLEEAKRQAKANIDQAVNNQGVEDAKTQGVQAVQGVNVGESQAKTDAKAEIQRVYNEKLTAIQQSNLFSAEKEEKRQALEQAKTEADRNIQQAQTNDEVNSAKTQGIQAIQNVAVGESQTKAEARQAIEQAYNEKRQAIDQSSLTNEEKEEKRQALIRAKDQALQSVNSADSNEAVEQAKTQGVQAIQNVVVGESQAKTEARQAVEQAYNAKVQALNEITPALTTEEKAERVRQLEEAKNTATTAIAQADTQANVTTAKEQGIANIGNVSVAESAKKAEARQAVEQANTAKLGEIERSSLTNEEKEAKRQELEPLKTNAINNVNSAENNEAVERAKTQGVQAIRDVAVGESQAKAAARQAVEEAYNNKLQDLDQITPALTTEEKAERVRQLDQAKDQAVQNIAQATSTADIDREKTAGLEALNNVSTQEDPAKVNARNAIETAYNAKLQALEQVRPSFTTEEKNGKVTLLDSLKNTALEEINQAVERNAVEEAKTRNENLLQNFDVGNSVKKAAAKATVDHAYTTKLEEIENASLTTEDRQSKVALLEESKRQAHTNIDQAANNQAVEDAKTQGVQAIQDIVVNESQAKTEAKAELQRAYEAKLSEITQSSLTNEEKAEKRQALNTAKDQALQSINNAENNEAVEQAKNQGVQAIRDVAVGDSQAKTEARQAVESAYEAKLREIDQSSLTNEEKESKRQALTSAKEQALQSVNNADSNEAVTTAKTQGVQNIEAVNVGESQAKAEARQAVEQANTEKLSEIERSSLTNEEKAEKRQELEPLKTNAITAINQAESNEAVTNAKTQGVQNIENLNVGESQVKTAAKAEVQRAYEAKLSEINASTMTSEEKETARQALNTAKTEAENAVDTATSNATVDSAKTQHVQNIQNVNGTESAKKAEARQAVEQAYNEKRQAIDQSSLTNEEKESKRQELEPLKTNAITAINQAESNEAVTNAKTQGLENIGNVNVAESTKKTEAKAEIQRAYEAKQAEINASTMTSEEKETARQELTQKKTEADNAVDTATTNDAVDSAKAQHVQSIQNVNGTESAKKEEARQAVEQANTEKLAEIERSSLTNEEKEEKRQALNTAKAQALQFVNNAENNEAVEQAKNQGVQAIRDVAVGESQVKAEARQAIEQASATKLEAINTSSLTNEEKAEKRQALNTAKAQALQSVNNAENNEAVEQAKTQGVQAIRDVAVGESQVKAEARQAIEQASATKLEAINTSSLTNEEKAEKRQAVAAAKDQALQSVNNAESNEAVTTAKNQGVQNIEAVTVGDSQAKTDARQAVEQASTTKLEAINTSSLTNEEKAEKRQALNTAKDQALQSINNAENNEAVEQAKNQGVQAIRDVAVGESQAKEAARQAIEEASATKLAEIEQSSLTNEEKEAKRQALNTAKAQALQSVNNADSNEAVTTAKNQGVQAIQNVAVGESQAKTDARQAVEEAYNNKLQALDQITPALTTEEKAERVRQLDEAKNNATTAIAQAETQANVSTAKEQGIANIGNVSVAESAKKAEARQAVEQASATKLSEINQSSLTNEEKESKRQALTSAKEQALQSVNNADSNEAVTTAKTQGVQNIEAVNVGESQAKAEARQAIEEASATKLSEIDQSSLTNEEKEAKRQAVATAKAQALQSINTAENNEAVEQAKTQGVEAVQAVTIGESQAKEAARQALQSAYSLKLQAINEITPALTTEEKAERVRQLDEAKTTATTAIDQALNNEAVTNAKTQGLTAINNVATTESAEKAEARALVEETYNSKLEEINNANLTESEKQEKRSALGNVKEQALQRVNNATDRAGVGSAAETGVQALQSFEVGSRPTENPPSTEGGTGTPSDNNGGTTDNNGGTGTPSNPSDNNGTGNNTGAGEQPTPPENQEANALQEAKTDAKALITASYDEKLAEINGSSLSETEKNSKREALETAKATAISAIDNASTNETVVAAAEAGVVNIQAITVPARPTENPPSTEGGTSGTPSDNNAGTGTPSTEGGSTGTPSDNNSGTGTPSTEGGTGTPSTPTDTTPVAPTETQEDRVFVAREANGTEKGMVRSANPMPNHKLHIDLSNVSASENRDVYDIYFKENDARKENVQGNFEVRLRRRAGAEVSKVVHLDNNGTVAETFEYRTEGDFVVFNTTHFSLYAIEYASVKPSITIPGIVYKAWNWVSTGKTEPVKDQVPNTSASSAFAGLCVLVGAGLVAMKKRK